ncbi:MAG: type II toxin-antitoxin system YoeB family toxin [Bryobacterales bacterium]|nr:type II toxin-antitoxin system YoeB family toxin [Bryobacterales bacterium]
MFPRSKSFAGRQGLPGKAERDAVFQREFREDLRYWVKADRSVPLRVLELVEALIRDLFAGFCKPERRVPPNDQSRPGGRLRTSVRPTTTG